MERWCPQPGIRYRNLLVHTGQPYIFKFQENRHSLILSANIFLRKLLFFGQWKQNGLFLYLVAQSIVRSRIAGLWEDHVNRKRSNALKPWALSFLMFTDCTRRTRYGAVISLGQRKMTKRIKLWILKLRSSEAIDDINSRGRSKNKWHSNSVESNGTGSYWVIRSRN